MNRPLPPHNVEVEEALLGALLVDPAAHALTIGLVDADDFYAQRNGWMYAAIDEAARDGSADLVAVADRLEAAGHLEDVGGTARLAGLIAGCTSALHAERYARIVRDRAIRRALIGAAGEVVRVAYDLGRDTGAVQARAMGAVMDAQRDTGGHCAEAAEIAGDALDVWAEWAENPLEPGQVRGLATGMHGLDAALGGLQSGVYIVAARPSMGKSSLIRQMITGLCERGERAVLFTIEQNRRQVIDAMVCSLEQVELRRVRRGDVDDGVFPALVGRLGEVADWPLTIYDQATLRPGDVLAGVRRAQMKHGDVSAVFVDGLWLMVPTRERENRTQTLGATSREMKQVQRELDLPLVMAHQLSRSCENRADKRPLLSDLRDSGDVEQDADVVVMLYRDDYYNPESERQHIVELLIRKNRLDGPAGVCVEMFWRGAHTWFCEAATHGTVPDYWQSGY